MNDIEVKVTQTAGVIESNFEEIKEALGLQMTAYLELEVTEDNIDERKKDLATLRKIYKAVDERKKEVKKGFMKPYEDFEKQVKDVLAVINEPINMIDTELKGFEEKRIAEKMERVKKIYDANIGEYAEYLPFESICKPSWKNKTCTDKDIIYDLSEMTMQVANDLKAIEGLHSEIEEQLFEAYKTTGRNLTAVIKKNTDYIEIKQQIAISEETKQKAEQKADQDNPWKTNVTFTVPAQYADSVRQFLEFNEIEFTEG